jgi:predicted flap endonuclease-1-like 5' DNA nuclease
MGLLTKLKSALGLDREERSAGSGSDVTVEREASTDSEAAVKEPTDESGGDSAEESGDESTDERGEEGVDEPVATESDASASTESLVDEEHTEDPTRAAEPAEAAESGDEAASEPDTESGEDVSTVKGIGPAYAERLHEAGVETVADLAAADPETLAEETDLSAKRVGRWVDHAQDQD